MSTSYSSPFSGGGARPFTSFQYRDTSAPPPLPHVKAAPEPPRKPEVSMTEAALAELLASTRAEAAAAAEARLRGEYESRAHRERVACADAIEKFRNEAKGYYTRVEKEIVRLALSIAARILHRESQIDPMLVAALVQLALQQLKDSTAVKIHVAPSEAVHWRAHFGTSPKWGDLSVVENGDLQPGGCLLETDLGTADFSLAAQLKEVEQGFFDVLAQKPER